MNIAIIHKALEELTLFLFISPLKAQINSPKLNMMDGKFLAR
jgi:hypothetical protein